jgi:prepilin-type processing-associated H-X9-DG protein
LQANGTELVQSNKDSDDSFSHEEWLFIQEADKLALWPSFPASPPLLTISYTSPPMTLVCESAESPYVRRIDRTNRMACASRPRVPDGNVVAGLFGCVEKIKRLELVLRMFENEDTEKRLPGGWISVVPNYMSDTMLLTCPCLGEKDELGRVVSYDLLFPVLTFDELREVAHELDVEADSDARLLSEIPLLNENHECSNSGGSHVLFADGHVELLMRNEWEVRVAPFVDYAERYYAGL